MSRYQARGINPENNETVDIFWGWDEVPGFKPGYFFQVYSRRKEDVEKDGEGILVNEGFLQGISEDRLSQLKTIWKAKTRL
jgi:hypothetical protein